MSISRALAVVALVSCTLALFGVAVLGLAPVKELAVAGITLSIAILL